MKKFTNIFVALLMIFAFSAFPFSSVLASGTKSTTNFKKVKTNEIRLKFNENEEVSLKNNQFVSVKGTDFSSINTILKDSKITKKSRLLKVSEESVKQDRQNLTKKHSNKVPNLNNYYRILLKDGININQLISEIDNLSYISEVYAAPIPAKSPYTPDFSINQKQFLAPPNGMGITVENTSYPGSSGEKVKIADVEFSWNTNHEDLSDARQSDTLLIKGTPVDPWNDANHGTAVAGILTGDKNQIGINGIVSDAKLHLSNTYSEEYGWDIANAIYLSMQSLSAGDVILIEQQAWGPEGYGYMPVEWIPEVYDAIKLSTLSGIIVVEAAGNGSENLDNPVFGTSFPQGKEDSGAIIVGAGSACDGSVNNSRLYFSNYGSRVNVQGFGECVTTTGYGYLYNIGGINSYYTNNFNGTSSASALVAGVVSSISSAYEQQKNSNISPLEMRSLLRRTGTAQNISVNPGNIGPLPNLKSALDSFKTQTDTTSPTVPRRLNVKHSKNYARLNWKASTDNSNNVTYRIYRNNVLLASTKNLNFVDSGLSRRTSYSYKIQAVDPSGNISGFSNSVTVKTR